MMNSCIGLGTAEAVGTIENIDIDNLYTGIDNHLKVYLSQLKYADVMDGDEQIRLLKEYRKTQCKELRNSVVNSNLRLVISVCKKYFKNEALDPMELVGVGNEALIIAAEKFNCEHGVRFSTYAVSVIEDRIHTFLNSETYSVEMSKESYRLKYKINQIYNEFEVKGDKKPSYKQIANLLIERKMLSADTISEELVRIIVENGQKKSLNEYISEGSNNVELGDTIIDSGLPFEIEVDNSIIINELITALTDKEAEVIKLKYFSDMGVTNIGKTLGINASTVKKFEARGLQKMKIHAQGIMLDMA